MRKFQNIKRSAHSALVLFMLILGALGISQAVQIQHDGILAFHVSTAHATIVDDAAGALGGGADDPFQKAGSKASSMLTSLTNVAVPFLALAIACLAIAMFTGRIETKRAITMMAGGFVIGSALKIATWVIK